VYYESGLTRSTQKCLVFDSVGVLKRHNYRIWKSETAINMKHVRDPPEAGVRCSLFHNAVPCGHGVGNISE